MKTNDLAKTTFVDDGECVSFHRFSSSLDTSSFIYSGFELLVLPEGAYRLTVAGEVFSLQGPQVLLLGPRLQHGWRYGDAELPAGAGLPTDAVLPDADLPTGDAKLPAHWGLAVRWPVDLLGEGFLEKRQTQAIAALLEKAGLGVRFDAAVVPAVLKRLDVLGERTGFAIYLELLALLHELSVAAFHPLLACLPAPVAVPQKPEKKSPIDEVMTLMQTHYFRPMTLEEMARKACMTKGSFCRSFRAKTGKTYSETLNEIRLGHICRLLAETTDTVSEIAYRAGYQNIHYFHRHFKRVKGCTPLEFREGKR